MSAITGNRFAYAQARIQARFAGLSSDRVWQHLEASRNLPGFLGEARLTSLEPWISGFSPRSEHDQVERELRRRLNALIAEAASWVPARWRDAVHWTAWLVELPRIAAQEATADARNEIPVCLRNPGNHSIGEIWLAHWRELWPDLSTGRRMQMDRLVDLALDHGRRFPNLPADQGAAARRRFATALRGLFRRTPLQPAALFAWLLLQALELEHLRGALVERALFGDAGEH